ncbi:hypothetical protein ABB02_00113 [Clostridiaceae bacterium JG1575]|nr:hypothetical protein ABB02_00113 [Clostridiaceae bacterium JG1575]
MESSAVSLMALILFGAAQNNANTSNEKILWIPSLLNTRG